MRPMTAPRFLPLCLAFLSLILSAPVSARPKPQAKPMQAQNNQAQAIRRQFAAKDAAIADLRRQVRALTGQVAELNARLEDIWPDAPADIGALTSEVQDYNRLLIAARASAVDAQKNHALQQAVSNGAAGTTDSSEDQSRYAAKEADELTMMKKRLLQAQDLYRKIKASPLYESRFYETDPAMKADEAPHALTFDTLGESVHLRFIQPR